MTAPSPGRDDATLRGAVVLVVAIVIGLALLLRSNGGGGGDEDAASDRSTESTTTVAGDVGAGDETTVSIQDSTSTASTAPTGSTQDPATITVAVLNATTTGGWAGENAAILASAQYVTVQGNFGGDDQATSMIYATPEAQADAQAVANLLNLSSAPVTQKPAEALADDGGDADAQVVVVLGADSVSTTDAGSTTTTTG